MQCQVFYLLLESTTERKRDEFGNSKRIWLSTEISSILGEIREIAKRTKPSALLSVTCIGRPYSFPLGEE